MDEVPILGSEDDRRIFHLFEAQYDAPAYIRRARGVEEAYEQVIAQCRQKRDELLAMVQTRLGMLRGLAGRWEALRPYLADDEQVALLERFEDELQPRLRIAVGVTSSSWTLRRALQELRESLDRFNRRWSDYLRTVDLARINELREGYNRYYLLEKECAIRSFRLAREGFQHLPPLTVDDLASLFPVLPIPRRA